VKENGRRELAEQVVVSTWEMRWNWAGVCIGRRCGWDWGGRGGCGGSLTWQRTPLGVGRKNDPAQNDHKAERAFGFRYLFNCVSNSFQQPCFNPVGGDVEKFSIQRKGQGHVCAEV
jgi:hypothetical protein